MIDVHTHAQRGWTRTNVERDLAQTGVDRTILLAMPLDHWSGALNDECAKLLAEFPDKFCGFIGIHPPDVDESLRRIDTYCKKGFIGIKLMPTSGYYPDDEKHRKVFEEINARKLIVLQHCGWCSQGINSKDMFQSTRFSEPYHVEPLARVFTDTDFILAHAGGRTYFPQASELTRYHQNIYIDTCPGQGTWTLRHGGHWLNHLNWKNVLFGTDMIWGSDSPARSAKSYAEKVFLVKSLVGMAGYNDRVDDVMHNNAVRLLRKHGVQI